MKQLIETIKHIAEKYQNIDTEIDKDIIRLKFYIEGIEYQTVEIAEGENGKLDVTILLDATKSIMVLDEVKELILILNKHTTLKTHTAEEVKEIKQKYKVGSYIEIIKLYDYDIDVPTGIRAVIEYIDELGNLHIICDNGKRVVIVIEIDEFKMIEVNEQ